MGGDDYQKQHFRGMAYMAVAAILFPVKDSFLKAQDPDVPALLAIAVYFSIHFIVGQTGLLLMTRGADGHGLAGMSRWHLARSLALTCSLGLFFFSLRYVPISLAVTLFTVQSLFIILFGRLLLGERIQLRHIIMLAIASVGVGIILRPDPAIAFNSYLFLPLISAAFFALNIVLTRKLGDGQQPLRLLCQDGAVACVTIGALYGAMVLMGAAIVPDIIWDPTAFLLPPVVAAIIGLVSSLGMIKAAQLAPTALIAPVSYLEIASGAVIGVLVFGETLSAATLVGIALIVGVCITNGLMTDG